MQQSYANKFDFTLGCYSYRFKRFEELTPEDNLFPGGVDTRGNLIHICRMYVNGEIMVGKASIWQKACWVPYQGAEVGSRDINFEVLTNPKRANLFWSDMKAGDKIQAGSIPGGRGLGGGQYLQLPETYYIGHCYWDTGFGDEVTPGVIHEKSGRFYLPWGGRAHECENFKILRCA